MKARQVISGRAFLVLCLGALLAVSSSCVVLPSKPLNEVIIAEDTLASIEVGRDTRESLAQLLGDPQLRTPDHSRWIYRTRVYNPSQSQLCVPAYHSFDCQQRGVTRHEFVDIRLAPDGTLEDLEIVETDESGCTDSGICTSQWPRALALYAEPDSHDVPEPSTPNLCTVYAYFVPASFAPAVALPLGDSFALQLGTDQTVWWVQAEDFINVAVQPGTRRVWAISQNELLDSLEWVDKERGWSDEEMAAAPWLSLDVDCGPGEVRYFELGYGRDGKQQILEVEDARGERETATRRRLISMYAGDFPFIRPVSPAMKP